MPRRRQRRPGAWVVAARRMAGKGHPPRKIAKTLGVNLGEVKAALTEAPDA